MFLSPSLQEFNPYVGEGDEEEYMNRIADAMEPYLAASGIDFGRNSTDQTLAQAIDLSNAGDYDLHLAIHSNAAGPALAGQMRGVDVYYRPGDADSLRAAEQIAADYREIYPDPNAIQILPGLMLAELEGTRAPAVLVETAYHDNTEDAQWTVSYTHLDAYKRQERLAQSKDWEILRISYGYSGKQKKGKCICLLYTSRCV